MIRVMPTLRVVALGAVAVLFLLGGFWSASAHVEMDAGVTAAGSSGLLRFSFSHGCDGSATTGIAIAIPEGVTSVSPGMNYGWTVEKITDEAATPASDGHGDAAPVTEVRYTAKEPVADGFYDELVLKVSLSEDAEGETLYFPVIQTCEDGEIAWIEIPAEGQDSEDLESPAPSVTVTAPEENGGGH